jgi:hypothetical protein|nr:hypothetical protein [Kofleriaceae bacterium]
MGTRLFATSFSVIAVSTVAACGPAAPAVDHAGGAAGTVAVAAPELPRAEFGVSAAELGDRDVLARIRHRAHVASIGDAKFVLDGPVIDQRSEPTRTVELPIYPVIGESGDHVRVVVDGDSARVAVWIPRRDAQSVALAPVRLGDDHGRADAVSGVTLGAGEPVVAQPAANGLRAVKLTDEYVDAAGSVPASAIGEVWVVGEHEPFDPANEDSSEPPPTHTGTEIAAGPIRVAASDGAAVVATAKQPLPARLVKAAGAWDEVEVHAKRVRVHGFVPASTVTANAPARDYGGYGHGGGFGMSDTIDIQVPAGACLYDRQGGEIIGVELEAKDRYSHGMVAPGWWQVVVYNDWGVLSAVVHDVSAATDPKAASWETCTK